jgi:GNAT superfamily N-acetyltransferase
MLEVKLTRTTCDAYGLYDYRVVPFGGTPYITIFGEILVNGEQVGRITMYELNADINLYDMACQIPGDILVIAEQICDNDGCIKTEFNINDKFVIVDNIEIDPEYRGKGYGSLVAKHLLVYLNDAYNHQIDAVVLYASMYEIEDCEEMDLPTFNNHSDKLVKFYKKAGFDEIQCSVMIKKKG